MSEGGIAEPTLVGSFISMCHHVVLQVQLGRKLTTTYFTHDRFGLPPATTAWAAINTLLFVGLDAMLRPEMFATQLTGILARAGEFPEQERKRNTSTSECNGSLTMSADRATGINYRQVTEH